MIIHGVLIITQLELLCINVNKFKGDVMIQRLEDICINLRKGICWETITIKNGLFLDYLETGRELIGKLIETEESQSLIDIVKKHQFRSQMIPVAWDDSWESPLNNLNSFEVCKKFLAAAKRLKEDSRSKDSSLGGFLRQKVKEFKEKNKTFRIIVPRKYLHQDWLDFLRSCPAFDGDDPKEIEKHFLLSSNLHSYFEQVDYVIHVGMIWQNLGGDLNQILTAPRWNHFMHVMMEGTTIFSDFPDFLTPIIWEKERSKEGLGLRQFLSDDQSKEPTGLVIFDRKSHEINGPERPLPLNDVQNDDNYKNDFLPDEEDVDDNRRESDYSGKSIRITTKSGHSFYQPIFKDASRGILKMLCKITGNLIKTSHVAENTVILCPSYSNIHSGGTKGSNPDNIRWKNELKKAIEGETVGGVAGYLAGNINLKNLNQGLKRWTNDGLLNAPKKKKHFLALCKYLNLKDFDSNAVWSSIRSARKNAIQSGRDAARKRNIAIRDNLRKIIESAGKLDVSSLVIENGANYLYKDGLLRIFLTAVETVESTPVKKAFAKCNKAYRIKKEIQCPV